MTASRRGRPENLCLVLKRLMQGTATVQQLHADTGVCVSCIRPILRSMQIHGLAYIAGRMPKQILREDGTYQDGTRAHVWSWQPQPYKHLQSGA